MSNDELYCYHGGRFCHRGDVVVVTVVGFVTATVVVVTTAVGFIDAAVVVVTTAVGFIDTAVVVVTTAVGFVTAAMLSLSRWYVSSDRRSV